MIQIKQTLTEELNKMKYMLGYQRGVVISEQTDAEWQTKYFCVTQLPGIQSKKLSDGSTMYEISTTSANGIKTYTQYYNNGMKRIGGAQGVKYSCDDPEFANVKKTSTDKIVGDSPKTQTPGTNIRSRVEADIKTENLGLTWAQVKQSFGSTGQASENQLLWKAWKGGWRPGKPVPDQLQTPTYQQNNQNAAGVTTSTTTLANASTTVTTTIAATSEFLVGKTEEEIQQKVEGLKEKVKEARQQKRMTKRQCKEIANAIDSKSLNPFKIPVADQEMCDTLRFCISQKAIEDTKFTDWSACDAFPAKSTTTTTTVSPAVTTTTTTVPVLSNKTAG